MSLDRRTFLKLAAGTSAAAYRPTAWAAPLREAELLRVPRYDQVQVTGGIAREQAINTQAVLATMDDDALLKPFRAMGGQPAPGRDIGGWYQYLPSYNWHTGDAGFAPGHCFGQWTSAMARFAVMQDDAAARNRLLRLHTLFAAAITPDFFDTTRFPAYTLDKCNIGLLDAHRLLGSSNALATADKVRQCALPSLPEAALDREAKRQYRKDRDESYGWDESYTLPENLYLLAEAGAGSTFLEMARRYRLDSFFGPLAQGQNVLGGLHGYSHMNALCSAMQAYLVDGSEMHLQAALQGTAMVDAQSYATGGWAPDELFEKPGSGKVLASLTSTHNNFETPCGTYATLKLMRYLLRLTRDGRYGDLAERVVFNSMFGALPLQPDGRTFYYADMNEDARRVYSAHRWPCCAGTYTQVAADYGISSYLLDPEPLSGLWVVLYLPSMVRWKTGGANVALTQESEYPLGDTVRFRIQADRLATFPLHLRVPAWCTAPVLRINGRLQAMRVERGFGTVTRAWRDGDHLELEIPAALRLEPFPANGGAQPALAALCRGPLVLMANQTGSLKTEDLGRVQRIHDTEWRLQGPGSEFVFRPFFAVGESSYCTYLRTS